MRRSDNRRQLLWIVHGRTCNRFRLILTLVRGMVRLARAGGAQGKTCEDGGLVAAHEVAMEGERGGGACNPLNTGAHIQICTTEDTTN